MSTSKTIICCAQCHRILLENEQLCPSCGSERKLRSIEIELTLPNPNVRLTVRDRTGFKTGETEIKYELFRKARKRSRDVLTIDRSDPNITKKVHHVEQAAEAGGYEVVHHHEDKFPAKRRPRK